MTIYLGENLKKLIFVNLSMLADSFKVQKTETPSDS